MRERKAAAQPTTNAVFFLINISFALQRCSNPQNVSPRQNRSYIRKWLTRDKPERSSGRRRLGGERRKQEAKQRQMMKDLSFFLFFACKRQSVFVGYGETRKMRNRMSFMATTRLSRDRKTFALQPSHSREPQMGEGWIAAAREKTRSASCSLFSCLI